jgi:hypothetical protein
VRSFCAELLRQDQDVNRDSFENQLQELAAKLKEEINSTVEKCLTGYVRRADSQVGLEPFVSVEDNPTEIDKALAAIKRHQGHAPFKPAVKHINCRCVLDK